MPNLSYRTTWFADAIAKHDTAASAEALDSGNVRVTRQPSLRAGSPPKNLNPVTIAPVAIDRLTTDHVDQIMRHDSPTVICLIPKRSHYEWTARERAEANGSTVHTMKEVFTALSDPDPRPHIDKNVAWARQTLVQHEKVVGIDMICEASMLVRRHASLNDVRIAIEYEYEFSQEAVVRSLERHPDVDAILNANPNGTEMAPARAHARHAAVGICRLGGMMGALHRADRDFISHQPANPHD